MASTFWARTDSGSANNPALNLTGDPAVEITFVPSGMSGDLILEGSGTATDPDTQVQIGGQTYDFTYELGGFLPTRKSDGAQQVPDRFEGNPVYIVTVQDYPAAGETTRLAFLPDDLATQSEMDAFGNGAIDVQGVDTTSPGAVCFAGGTRILTPQGEMCVDDLKAGDLVMTLDHGPQPILWVSQSAHSWPDSPEKELPVLISSGAFGQGAPRNDLVVSPQHKILVTRCNDAASSEAVEALVPAKGLTSLPGIRIMKGKRSVVYFHILLENHEIVMAEGLPSESFFPGSTALNMLLDHQVRDILSLVPGLAADRENGYGPRARDYLTFSQTKALVRICKKSGDDLSARHTRCGHAAAA
ncbi:Hint domain-containing protein [Sulfitobacter sabulilitoris]|uniref:Hint domain-containing protein n=1 Tax=Sulfitobacter sabulilitoris TaxID=2562655 RepID=A0A5S3PJ80_9RHOB|nr:Hint domain-containing protein [Sulfitobacter sabulilitoris]TMM54397.1 Hint domain-containing protein [Sulfitobacter sabulilitoris]